MNKLIEINNETITAVSGGCCCYCISKPFSFREPTQSIGFQANDSACQTECELRQLTYGRCKPNSPVKWISPIEYFSKIENTFI